MMFLSLQRGGPPSVVDPVALYRGRLRHRPLDRPWQHASSIAYMGRPDHSRSVADRAPGRDDQWPWRTESVW